jgi:hypothetical protein
MAIRPTLAALSLTLVFTAAGFAQEYGRASGGEIATMVKVPSGFSASLQMEFPFLAGNGVKRTGGTFGGTLVKDRVWFFASAEKMNVPTFATTAGPITNGAGGANLTALLGDRQSLNAIAGGGRATVTPLLSTTPLTLPSSFLNLHYTGIISSNAFFTASVSRNSVRTQ